MKATLGRLGGGRRAQVAFLLAAAFGAGALMNALDLNPAASQTVQVQSAPVQDDPGLDASAAAWSKATPIDVPLTAQNVTYPFGGGSVPRVTVRALNTRDRLYVRVDWADSTKDDRLAKLTDFSDAVAVEFPSQATVSTPSICMGQANGAVNIWQWRAVLEGSDRPAQDHPNRYIDDDPWRRIDPKAADLAYPARYVGNPISGVKGTPVSDLTAQAFGTLAPTQNQLAHGKGVWQDGRWSVVFARDLNTNAPDEAKLGGGVTTDMAVAIWDGARGDRNGQKSVSQFVKLAIPAQMVVREDRTGELILLLGGGAAALAIAAAVGWWMVHERR